MKSFICKFKKSIYFFDIPEIGYSFEKKLTEKGKEKFIKKCGEVSKLFDTPLYTFKCDYCKSLQPVVYMNEPRIYQDENGKSKVYVICDKCIIEAGREIKNPSHKE